MTRNTFFLPPTQLDLATLPLSVVAPLPSLLPYTDPRSLSHTRSTHTQSPQPVTARRHRRHRRSHMLLLHPAHPLLICLNSAPRLDTAPSYYNLLLAPSHNPTSA
ncbi:hypothetical protein QCA50_019747 [Cerrena zonata]|uniref:Uncharacterized protein n=1 Tax=Cerrena zonata TaxID=2478898 RepID=A0AAW0FA89_9APHY